MAINYLKNSPCHFDWHIDYRADQQRNMFPILITIAQVTSTLQDEAGVR
jgi:hypothetical protein